MSRYTMIDVNKEPPTGVDIFGEPDDDIQREDFQRTIDNLASVDEQREFLMETEGVREGVPLPMGIKLKDGSLWEDAKAWDEEQHPRDPRGEFVEAGASARSESVPETSSLKVDSISEAVLKFAAGDKFHENLRAVIGAKTEGIQGRKGVSDIEIHDAVGVYRGQMEMSALAFVRADDRVAAEKWAEGLRSTFSQDSVMLFFHGDGPDTVQRVRFPNQDAANEAAKTMTSKHGLEGGSYDLQTNELRIAMAGTSKLSSVKAMAKEYGGKLLPADRGEVVFVSATDGKSATATPGGPVDVDLYIRGVSPGWYHGMGEAVDSIAGSEEKTYRTNAIAGESGPEISPKPKRGLR